MLFLLIIYVTNERKKIPRTQINILLQVFDTFMFEIVPKKFITLVILLSASSATLDVHPEQHTQPSNTGVQRLAIKSSKQIL